jgi:hypothetical protein
MIGGTNREREASEAGADHKIVVAESLHDVNDERVACSRAEGGDGWE